MYVLIIKIILCPIANREFVRRKASDFFLVGPLYFISLLRFFFADQLLMHAFLTHF